MQATDPTPGLRWLGGPVRGDTGAVVLMLHGGRVQDTRPARPRHAAYLRMLAIGRWLRRDPGIPDVPVGLLRYRYRGWNQPVQPALADARWAIGRCRERYPERSLILLGHSLGGRVALRLAAEPGVGAVCALAPWIEAGEPAEQLAGRIVRIAHGTRDSRTDPVASRRFADQAGVSWQAIEGAGHAMLRHRPRWHAAIRACLADTMATPTAAAGPR